MHLENDKQLFLNHVFFIFQGQIDHIQSHISDIQTITPDFISTAKQVAGDSKEEEHVTIAMEQQLDLLSHEWATKAWK